MAYLSFTVHSGKPLLKAVYCFKWRCKKTGSDIKATDHIVCMPVRLLNIEASCKDSAGLQDAMRFLVCRLFIRESMKAI